MLALWALPEDALEQYLSLRKPRIGGGAADVTIGRAVLPRLASRQGEGEAADRPGGEAQVLL